MGSGHDWMFTTGLGDEASRRPSGDVELVALGVGHEHPAALLVVVDVHQGGAEADQPLDLDVDELGADHEVEVHPVLHRLRLGHRLEQEAPTGARAAPVDAVVGVAERREVLPAELAVDPW